MNRRIKKAFFYYKIWIENIHPNNCSRLTTRRDLSVPSVMEFTFY